VAQAGRPISTDTGLAGYLNKGVVNGLVKYKIPAWDAVFYILEVTYTEEYLVADQESPWPAMPVTRETGCTGGNLPT
jgi:hypothetical protein